MKFEIRPGCWSWIGMLGNGRQELDLKSTGCMDIGTIEHEFLHALGVHHEQTRPDGDNECFLAAFEYKMPPDM